MKNNKLASRFVLAANREAFASYQKLVRFTGGYAEEQKFYIKLGIEMTLANIATLVGANNSTPKEGPKWYIHSPRKQRANTV